MSPGRILMRMSPHFFQGLLLQLHGQKSWKLRVGKTRTRLTMQVCNMHTLVSSSSSSLEIAAVDGLRTILA